MTLRALLFSLLLLALSGIAAAETLPSHCVILPQSLGPALIQQCSRISPASASGFWTPTVPQILAIEHRLPELLRKSGHKIDFAVSRRQYIGFVARGKKLIYLNAFPASTRHPDDDMDWKTTAVTICDGGDAVWGVEFDPNDETFHNLAFNGEA